MDSFMNNYLTRQQNLGQSFIRKDFLLQRYEEMIEFRKANEGRIIYSHTDLSRPTPVLFEVALDDDTDERNTETPMLRLTPYLLFVLKNESRRLEIKDLCLAIDTVNQDKYFLCRVIAAPYATVALQFVADTPSPEDDFAVRVALYNFTKQRKNLDKLLPIGTKLVILNPFLKITNDGGLSLTSYHPAEVAKISDDQLSLHFPGLVWPALARKPEKRELEKKGLAMKKRGNEYFSNGKYDQAILYYTKGLQALPNHEDLLTNRAAAYLQTKNYDLACVDANKVLLTNSIHLKATFRLAKAEMGLKRYDKTIQLLDTKIAEAECFKTKDFQDLLDEAKRLQKTAEQQVEPLKRKANQSFVGGDYEDSIRFYTLALDVLPYDDTLLSNRAAAFLQLHMYDQALLDAEKSLATNPMNEKASLRFAKALIGLKKFKYASNFLEAMTLLPNSSIQKECLRLIEEVKMFI